jgi:hypothetical protein
VKVLDAVLHDVAEPVDPGDFRRRLSALRHALELDFAILRGEDVIALRDFRIVGRNEDGELRLARSDARRSCGKKEKEKVSALNSKRNLKASLTASGRDLALIRGVVVEHDGEYVEREVTFLVASHHRVALEATEIAVLAEAEVILRPLKLAGLGHHSTRQRHSRADNRGLVLRFHGEALAELLMIPILPRAGDHGWQQEYCGEVQRKNEDTSN